MNPELAQKMKSLKRRGTALAVENEVPQEQRVSEDPTFFAGKDTKASTESD